MALEKKVLMRGRGRSYPAEFKAEAVELYRSSDKSIRDIAAELGISPESLRRWNVQLDIDAAEIFDFIEGFYNPHRLHSSLGYLSPIEFEEEHLAKMQLTQSESA